MNHFIRVRNEANLEMDTVQIMTHMVSHLNRNSLNVIFITQGSFNLVPVASVRLS